MVRSETCVRRVKQKIKPKKPYKQRGVIVIAVRRGNNDWKKNVFPKKRAVARTTAMPEVTERTLYARRTAATAADCGTRNTSYLYNV